MTAEAQYFRDNLDVVAGAPAQGDVWAWDAAQEKLVVTNMGTQIELDAAVAAAPVLAPATSARNVIQPTGAAIVPLTLKGFAGQTGDFIQILSSGGTLQGKFRNDGMLCTPYVSNVLDTGPYFFFEASQVSLINRGAASNVPLKVNGSSGHTGNLTQWLVNSVVMAKVDSGGGGYFATLQNPAATGPYFALGSTSVELRSIGAAQIPLALKGFAAQSGDLFQIQDSATAVLAKFTAAGALEIVGNPSPGIILRGLTSNGSDALVVRKTTDAFDRLRIRGTSIDFGGGAAAADVQLLWVQANVLGLASGDSLQINIGGGLTIGENTVPSNGGIFLGRAGGGEPFIRFRTGDGATAGSQIRGMNGGGVRITNDGATLNWFQVFTDGDFQAEGKQRWIAANEQATVGAAGAASALPANPTKYLKVKGSDGTTYVVPAYLAA